MKGLYIFYRDIDQRNLSGIDKKVVSQIKTFNENGLDCKLITIKSNKDTKMQKLYNTIASRVPFGNADPAWKYKSDFDNVDFIYLRRPTSFTIHMINFLKKVKRNNSDVKIILELPTYPYDDELNSRWIDFPRFIKDKYNRPKLKGLIDRIAVQNDLSSIFGIPVLKFTNGIRVKEIEPRKSNKLNGINMCAVASLEPWQGYERVILGLSAYYKNGGTRKFKVEIVGEGRERDYYENLINENELTDKIKLKGFLNGRELNNVYDHSDLALDAFGRYKTNNDFSTSLKSREYLAKGLPIISGSKIDILDSQVPFYLEFPSDSSVIDFNEIEKFYDHMYKNQDKDKIIGNIREYANETCDMSNTMNNIITYIKL